MASAKCTYKDVQYRETTHPRMQKRPYHPRRLQADIHDHNSIAIIITIVYLSITKDCKAILTIQYNNHGHLSDLLSDKLATYTATGCNSHDHSSTMAQSDPSNDQTALDTLG